MAKSNPNAQRVLCVSTGRIYESMRDAARDLGVAAGSISSAISGKRRRAGGYIVEAYDHEIQEGSLQEYCERRLIEEALRR